MESSKVIMCVSTSFMLYDCLGEPANVLTSLQKEIEFSEPGSDFPKEAEGINSFFFLEVCELYQNPMQVSARLTQADCSLKTISTPRSASTSSSKRDRKLGSRIRRSLRT